MRWLDFRGHRTPDREVSRRGEKVRRPEIEGLETRALLAAGAGAISAQALNLLSTQDVETLLQRAAGATASNDGIIAVVDRGGNILGVRLEDNVSTAITGNPQNLVFAIDGAIAKARTGAFFANSQAPLTSRTIQNISQSTMTQREIESNPDIPDPNSTLRGPGFVAPIGKKGHFPARVMYTPQVDLFQIEHTNRDSIVSPGPDRIRGTPDDITLPSRFNADPNYIPPGQGINAPESYGFATGILPDAQSRGIATLPGGIPLYKNGTLVGGIGVFYPGQTGYATAENSSLNDAGFFDPTKPDRSLEAEYAAFVAAGGSKAAGVSFNNPRINKKLGLPSFPNGENFDLPFGRIDLVGITLDLFGGHGRQGPRNLVDYGRTLGVGNPDSGTDQPVNTTGATLLPGAPVPEGWLVLPHASADGTLTADDVTAMINRGIAEAKHVRAAIRLPLNSQTRMVFAVTDKTGEVLGLYRMPDATVFSIDVAVAKARNVAYYANPNELQPIDQVANLPKGVAMTNRTFRYLTEPRFPEGVDGNPPGPFSILNDVDIRNDGPALPPSAFQSVQGFDSFNPQSNFHDPFNVANQNGIVFFPGSAPVYNNVAGSSTRQLVGGLGVSGDGVDQDDDVTYEAAKGFTPPRDVLTADQVFVRGVRLPYQKFNRNPHLGIGESPSSPITPQPILPGGQTGLTPQDIRRLQKFNQQARQAARRSGT
ncbi:heme-degrading domain-containing protein [Singulisphaera acidiphila]|uniref:Uncharacterized protein, possibly involved in utilization of glycolate and propanediol n=1 Tax=Singulisphaera acidiphila (strain ATCC BAA-1392 / DSM 18658 / VKM B-2454 / MOB10) TaxID=886293 RepID=L0D8X2_SINAD|nr:heme-binding protein [Singulisphaera acidiphila]AGA25315.1 uncharacterized protein, possibly involved in utilization of glycolate and propanediol [Singulisphaera acidiphila DSM 18658]